MKSTIHIETYTMAAYRAIRPALVASIVGYLGVSGMTFSATIDIDEYPMLANVVSNAAQCAGVPRNEYAIINLHTIKTSE
jgi:hypothetical protein